MALFFPTAAVERVTDITPGLLSAMKVKAILLDVDNTLALHGSQEPFAGSIEWARNMRDCGMKILILSNNFGRRVAPFAAQYGLPFQSLSLKPLPWGYGRAVRRLGVRKGEAVVVGDQIFTDVLGANLSFMKSILLTPQKEETSLSFRLRRMCERPIRRRVAASGRGKKYFR